MPRHHKKIRPAQLQLSEENVAAVGLCGEGWSAIVGFLFVRNVFFFIYEVCHRFEQLASYSSRGSQVAGQHRFDINRPD